MGCPTPKSLPTYLTLGELDLLLGFSDFQKVYIYMYDITLLFKGLGTKTIGMTSLYVTQVGGFHPPSTCPKQADVL